MVERQHISRIEHWRYQRPVGQGFFHTAEIYLENAAPKPLRYVYDCGAMPKYANAREREVDQYLSELDGDREIDFLFISHAHADHLNGLERLLDPSSGVRVHTIILPLLSIKERLAALGKSLLEENSETASGFYAQFIVAPLDALAQFEPKQVLFVRRGGEEGAPWSRGEPPEGWPEGGEEIRGLDREGRVPWKLGGTGQVDRTVPAHMGADSGSARVIPDTAGVIVLGASHDPGWLLSPYVDPAIEREVDAFGETLANELGIPNDELSDWIENRSNLESLVTKNAKMLREAYKSLSGDLNLTSLSLFSGCVWGEHQVVWESGFWRYWGHVGHYVHSAGAWLGTGDADLKVTQRRSNFANHYRALFRRVHTLTLPHHGSDHNLDARILDDIEPILCVAGADAYSNWKHPGTETVRAVCSRGIGFHTVTSDPRSLMREAFYFRRDKT